MSDIYQKYMNPEIINKIDNLSLRARLVVEGFIIGMHKSPYHGFSVEFSEHRLYNSGDSLKHIDWKLFARSDKLFVKKFEEETNLRSYVLIDTSSSMYYPDTDINKMSFSVYAAASLMYLFQKQRDGFGLTFFSDEIDFFSESKGTKTHYNRLLAKLDELLKGNNQDKLKQTNFPLIVSNFVQKIPQRSLVIIFSDMINFDYSNSANLFEALQNIRYHKNEVILFHVQDLYKEKLFQFANQPYNFRDLENNSEVKLNPINFKDIYRKSYDDFQSALDDKCNQFGIDYIPSFIHNGFSEVLISYLIKRSKLF